METKSPEGDSTTSGLDNQQMYNQVMYLTRNHEEIEKWLTSIEGGIRGLTERFGVLDLVTTTLRVVQEKVSNVELELEKQ